MKVRASVYKIVDIEIEVDDKYLSLSNDEFFNNYSQATNLSKDLAETIENQLLLQGEDCEVIYIEDMEDKILFEK